MPPLVHIVEALNQEYRFSTTKSLPGTPWHATKAMPPRLAPSSRSPWPRFPRSNFSMKDGVSMSLAQSHLHRSTPSRRVDDLSANHQSSKGREHQGTRLVHTRTKAQGSNTHLRTNLVLTLSKGVLRTKDMITKHLDGLETLLDMGVTSRNFSNSKMAGWKHIYSPQIWSSHL